MSYIKSIYRTHTCGEISVKNANESVKIAGWVHNKRDHGGVLFIDLRDHYGITQLVIDNEKSSLKVEDCAKIPFESVIHVSGTVVKRVENAINKNNPTGEIEILVENLQIESKSDTLPFQINNDENVNEDLRLKYRFLDLRREKLHNNIIIRSQVIKFIREQMYDMGFTEFQTPILTASSPEGARDFLVPSRLNPGKFYALPQAPQQFKQLLMVSGFDRYFQIAPCFRDEDARADRTPGEFYQLDVEMSFVEEENVLQVAEKLTKDVFGKFGNKHNINFIKFAENHLPLVEKWLSEPDVAPYHSQYSENRFRNLMQSQTIHSFVFCSNNKPIGYMHFYKIFDDNDYKNNDQINKIISQNDIAIDLFIGDGDFRNHGYGANIMQQIVQFVKKDNNIGDVYLGPHTDNARAIKCYHQANFRNVLEFVDGKEKNCILMKYDDKFPRIKYKDSLLKYGTDKPDLRNPIENFDATECFVGTEFSIRVKVKEKGAVIRGIPVPNGAKQSGSFFDKIKAFAQKNGAEDLSWIIFKENGEVKSPIAKLIPEEKIQKIREKSGIKNGDAVFFSCDRENMANKIAGLVRTEVGKQLDLIQKNCYKFAWIVDFPYFEWNEDEKKIEFSHNPFSKPKCSVEELCLAYPKSFVKIEKNEAGLWDVLLRQQETEARIDNPNILQLFRAGISNFNKQWSSMPARPGNEEHIRESYSTLFGFDVGVIAERENNCCVNNIDGMRINIRNRTKEIAEKIQQKLHEILTKDIKKIDLLNLEANQYDLVCNGYECLSGAIRNSNVDMMYKVFGICGYSEDDVTSKFAGMINAFKYGVPPHGGCAFGLERFVMLLTESENIREVIAFPMNGSGQDLMMNAPSIPFKKQLDDLFITVNLPEKTEV